MSFFRNFRSKVRNKSSSRDTTPGNSINLSRPSSVLSNVTTHTIGLESVRRESIDSNTNSLLNRSHTFILDSDQEEDKESKQTSSNNSTLEKKSKKSKVLSKFSTFTKRKKTPTPEKDDSLEHHPSDNATNTYYKWKTDGPSSAIALDYDAQTDPFHFLYEQHSSLKDMQKTGGSNNANGSIHSTHSSTNSSNGMHTTHTQNNLRNTSNQQSQKHQQNQQFDSSTFRKGKMPVLLKEQLSQLKTQAKSDLHESEELCAEPADSAADKYKTVTLSSFRKSFRDKFLQNQNNPAHNPAWFVEVEEVAPKVETRDRAESKENRPDFLIFDNDNYRPNSRSPLRDNKKRTPRSVSRSPVKRNQTFRVERPERQDKRTQITEAPSIRIEIKNSITPNMPSRIVPVGVAKPMPAQESIKQRTSARNTGGVVLAITTQSKTTKAGDRDKSPIRNWTKPITVTPVRYPSAARAANSNLTTTNGRYQTLVQIRNDVNTKSVATTHLPLNNNSRYSTTHIQMGNAGGSPTLLQKRLQTPGTRHSLATPLQTNALRSYELVKKSPTSMTTRALTDQQSVSASSLPLRKPQQQPKHTYFGDIALNSGNNRPVTGNKSISNTTLARLPFAGTSATSTSRLQQPQVVRIASASHTQQAMQRRSRSPIKMPWR